MDDSGKIKETPPLIMVQMVADLWTILAGVGVIRWGLDDIDVGVFC